MLKNRERIVANIRIRYLKKSHKFGIELLKIMEQALALDAKNSNTIWADAIAKKVLQLADGTKAPIDISLCNVVWYLTSKWRT